MMHVFHKTLCEILQASMRHLHADGGCPKDLLADGRFSRRLSETRHKNLSVCNVSHQVSSSVFAPLSPLGLDWAGGCP